MCQDYLHTIHSSMSGFFFFNLFLFLTYSNPFCLRDEMIKQLIGSYFLIILELLEVIFPASPI